MWASRSSTAFGFREAKRTVLLLTLIFSILIKGVAGDPALGVGPLPKCLYPFPVAQRLKTSEVVFSGRVIDIKKDGEQEEISFKVFKSWKNVHSSEV